MEIEFPPAVDLIEPIPEPKEIAEHDKHSQQPQHPEKDPDVAEFIHIEKEIRIGKIGDGGPQNEDIRHIDERNDEAVQRSKHGKRPFLVKEDIVENEEKGREEMIGHISDVSPIVQMQGRFEQKNDDEEGDKDHDDGHELERPQLSVVSFPLPRSHPLHRIGKDDDRDDEHKIIADIGVELEKIPREFIPPIDADIKDAEGEQAGKRRNNAKDDAVD